MAQKNNKHRRDFMNAACVAIEKGDFIPIFGDTIRNEHIFDVDDDDNIGIKQAFWGNDTPIYRGDMLPVAHELAQQVDVVGRDIDKSLLDGGTETETKMPKGAPNLAIDFERMNVTEELAYYWVKSFEASEDDDLKYPLADSFNIARVAQYLTFISQEFPIVTNKRYLNFLKKTLLNGAKELANIEGNEEEIAFLGHLERHLRDFSFADLVTELDFPRFYGRLATPQDDPVRLLAKLNQKLYITTSYHNFIERELEALHKKPRTRICRWHDDIKLPDALCDQQGEMLTVNEPIVFHLFGIEECPESLVLSENDYLEFLWALGRDKISANDSGLNIIPNYVESSLRNNPLLLLGYRLHDWDLRMVLRGLLRSRQEKVTRRGPMKNTSMAIQIDIAKQPLVTDPVHAEAYLHNYYGEQVNNLSVEFDDCAAFVKALYEKYMSGDWEEV